MNESRITEMPRHKMLRVTPQSVAEAKAYQAAERRKVAEATGIVITDEAVESPAPKYIYHCTRPGCRYTASAQREWQAVRSLGAHLIKVHLEQGK